MVLARPLVAGRPTVFRLRVNDSTGEWTNVDAKVLATSGVSRTEDTFIGGSDVVLKVAEVSAGVWAAKARVAQVRRVYRENAGDR